MSSCTRTALITSQAEAESMAQFVLELFQAGKRPMLTVEYGNRIRTPAQNRALHLFLSELADALNGAGLDMRRTLKPEINIPWTKETCKEHLWKPIQKALTKKKSTTQINTAEVAAIYDTLSRFMAEKHGLRTPDWPADEPPPF